MTKKARFGHPDKFAGGHARLAPNPDNFSQDTGVICCAKWPPVHYLVQIVPNAASVASSIATNVLKKRATVFTRAGILPDILLYLQAARISAIRPLRINDFGIVC